MTIQFCSPVSLGGVMENRWSIRKNLSLDVDILYQGQQYARCKTRDIGLGGMFIEVANSMIPRFGKVELHVQVDQEGIRAPHKFVASVVHTTNNGMGLMFQDFNIADFRVLQEVLRLSPSGELIH